MNSLRHREVNGGENPRDALLRTSILYHYQLMTKKNPHLMLRIRDNVSNDSDFNVHRSVQIRMETQNLIDGRYVPSAKFEKEPKWVD